MGSGTRLVVSRLPARLAKLRLNAATVLRDNTALSPGLRDGASFGYDVEPGRHEVRVELAGLRSGSLALDLQAGEQALLIMSFRRVRRLLPVWRWSDAVQDLCRRRSVTR
jgi:hypothetical protein